MIKSGSNENGKQMFFSEPKHYTFFTNFLVLFWTERVPAGGRVKKAYEFRIYVLAIVLRVVPGCYWVLYASESCVENNNDAKTSSVPTKHEQPKNKQTTKPMELVSKMKKWNWWFGAPNLAACSIRFAWLPNTCTKHSTPHKHSFIFADVDYVTLNMRQYSFTVARFFLSRSLVCSHGPMLLCMFLFFLRVVQTVRRQSSQNRKSKTLWRDNKINGSYVR